MRLLLNWSQMIDRQSSSKIFAMGICDAAGRSRLHRTPWEKWREWSGPLKAGILIRSLDPGTVDAT